MTDIDFSKNNCYLPIYQEVSQTGLFTYSPIWSKFMLETCGPPKVTGNRQQWEDSIQKWNGRLINDVVVFNTEQDKMWFVLNWS